MATDWTAIFRDSDGVLVGCGTVLPETLPPGTSTKTYASRPDQGTRWNTSLRDFEPAPAPVLVDRLADMVAHPYLAGAWSRLTASQRTQLRKAMVWLLGTHRYRQPLEEIALDVDPTWPTNPANVVE